MQLTYDQLRNTYQCPEELAKFLFDMLTIQDAKLKKIETTLASQAKNKRRENR
jgi:hypothetical protein